MRFNLRKITLLALFALSALLSTSLLAETVMTPRDKAAFEAELRALNEKYGPKAGGAMAQGASSMAEPKVVPVPETEAAPVSASAVITEADSQQAAESALLSAKANQQLDGDKSAGGSATKLRIELSPKNAREFVFDGQSYTQPDLMPILQALKQTHALDYVVLLQDGAAPVQLTHIVELAKISRALSTPAVYQDGSQLRAVDAR